MSDEDKKEAKHREEWERRSREYQTSQEAERIRQEHERQRNIVKRLGRIVDSTAQEILEEEQKVQSIARQQLEESIEAVQAELPDKQAARIQKRQEQQAKRQVKQAKRQAKKIQRQERRDSGKKARRHLIRLFPVFCFFTVLTIASAYFISPYGKLKEFTVSGNEHQTNEAIVAATKVDVRDYTLTVLQNRKAYEKRIQQASPWIRQVSIGYQFPTAFPIQVEEYAIVAYQTDKEKVFPILANGKMVQEDLAMSDLPSSAVRVQLKDEKLYPVLSEQLLQVDAEIRDNIQEMKSTASKASTDLVTISMRDGNQVLIPLSELSRKLIYYPSIAKDIKEPSLIDMEAGAFAYPLSVDGKLEEANSSGTGTNQSQITASVTQN